MLTVHQIIPPLTARTPEGRIVQAWDYKQKRSLAILFLHAECRPCEDYFARLLKLAAALAENDSVLLAIFPSTPAISHFEHLPKPIVIATDVSGRSQRTYLGDESFAGPLPQLGVFLTDRYGELKAQWLAREADGLPAAEEILSWLAQIQVACEECGTPHWAE